jgi:energy coupling factor transporter S component ThiW
MSSNDTSERSATQPNITKRIATAAIMVGVGVVLSYLNPFAYFLIFGTKINPFVHIVNAIMGVLVGMTFAVITAAGIAIIRFSLAIGTIHAFHGGITGAIVVGIVAYILWKKAPKYVTLAALAEPIGTVFIGGTIAQLIAPIAGNGLLVYWYLFAASCIPGCIIGFLVLLSLKKARISREDFF